MILQLLAETAPSTDDRPSVFVGLLVVGGLIYFLPQILALLRWVGRWWGR